MASDWAMSAGGPKLNRLFSWFDPETAAVVAILLGLFQLMLSVPLAYADPTQPKLFILPLVLGIVIMTAGSFTMASERNPSRRLLQACACSNVSGMLAALLAFILYCYSLSTERNNYPCGVDDRFYGSGYECPGEILASYCWILTLLLLLYDTGAVVLHSFLSVSALKTLKTD